MQMMNVSIETQATGKRIRQLIDERGLKVSDIKSAMGFTNPQAVYKWLKGETLPSIDNFVRLSILLGVSIEEILVLQNDGDFFFIQIFLKYNLKNIIKIVFF